jgi:hypothetical protein
VEYGKEEAAQRRACSYSSKLGERFWCVVTWAGTGESREARAATLHFPRGHWHLRRTPQSHCTARTLSRAERALRDPSLLSGRATAGREFAGSWSERLRQDRFRAHAPFQAAPILVGRSG